jgi:pyruvate/2-oxoglutarate dehydrogenase complex dihydrolipoamide acyltransferase (E2) component
MIRLPAATAAILLAFTFVSSPGARACDEDCYYEAQEAAYERDYERASAREEAAEEGYDPSEGRSSSRSSRRAKPDRAVAKQAAPTKNGAEPKPSTPAQSPASASTRTKVAAEPSSITSGSNDVAVDDRQEPRPAKAEGCKSYFPSVGMTLSVPCD